MAGLRITKAQIFLTQPRGVRCKLGIVRVETNQPGLIGWGCATYTQRIFAVQAAFEKHIGPYVTGKDPRNIEDLWRGMMVAGYWRNGPVLNNAISGVDMALWDIKGKLAGMPCYALWGGKCRPGAWAYCHADGKTPEEVAAHAVRLRERYGLRFIRCQIGGYSGLDGAGGRLPDGAPPGAYYDPKEKLRRVPAMFDHLRRELGDEIELLYDVHERLAPIDAIQLAKAVEPYRLFFLEDVLAPEDQEYLALLRSQCATPIAMGELFNNPQEMTPFIARRLFDFIRVHVSQIGGVTPALKLAHLCDAFAVRTAWHGPGDVSPIGMAANVHMDLALHNFGVQEWGLRTDVEYEMFPGTPVLKDGMVWANDQPGWGIDFRPEIAARFPCEPADADWTTARLPDGTLVRP